MSRNNLRKQIKSTDTFHRKETWKKEVVRLGLSIEEDGSGKFVAHQNGREVGMWDPAYGGAGHGWIDKSRLNMRKRIKSNEPEEEKDNDMNDETEGKSMENYGAQCLRKVHDDHKTLMGDYEDMKSLNDHPDIDRHLEKMQTNFAKHLDDTEKIFTKHYKDLPPLEDAEEHDEHDEEENEEGDGEDTEEADSNNELPDVAEHPEAVKSLRRKMKFLRVRVKALEEDEEKAFPEMDEETEEEDKDKMKRIRAFRKAAENALEAGNELLETEREDAVEGKRFKNRSKRLKKFKMIKNFIKSAEDALQHGEDEIEMGRDDAAIGKDENIPQTGELEPHEEEKVKEASDFLTEKGQPGSSFHDEDKMKSFHFHKSLEDIHSAHGGDTEKFDTNLPDYNHITGKRMGVDDAEVPEEGEDKIDAIGAASQHLKSLSTENAFGDEHRMKCVKHAKALSAQDQMDNLDEMADVTEPGEMGEKDMDDEMEEEDERVNLNEGGKRLAKKKRLAKDAHAVAVMRKNLKLAIKRFLPKR